MSTKLLGIQFDDFADDLLAERMPRPMIIVGASRIDTLLSDILTNYLLPKRVKEKENDELLEGDRPLSTFSARIKLCYRLGIIDDSLCATLETLRGLRNLCAHSVTFDTAKSPAREYVRDIHAKVSTRSSFKLVKDRYYGRSDLSKSEELQCVLLTLCAILEAVKNGTIRTTGTKATLTISMR
jgi:DNA-binding MltR family transcriptional regulator